MCEELYDYIVLSLLGCDACVRNYMTISIVLSLLGCEVCVRNCMTILYFLC